jgi:hypothetical protein
MTEHGAGLNFEEVRLLDRFADATTSSPGCRVVPVTVRDGDCYVLRSALDELGRLRLDAARPGLLRHIAGALSRSQPPRASDQKHEPEGAS